MMYTLKSLNASNRAGFVAAAVFQMAQMLAAFLGLGLLFVAMALYARPDLREAGESQIYAFLHERKVLSAGLEIEPLAHERATAINLLDLTEEQATIAYWLSSRYRVAPEPLGALVAEAYALGDKHQLDPKLILSVMAIESRFNPFAQSAVGAQGLMQVMTKVHEDKYEHFGGGLAAFDPVTNLQVGSLILQDCISRFGGVQNGLRCYVGAAKLPNDGGYSAKVMAEHARLENAVKNGGRVLPAQFRAALRAKLQDAELGNTETPQTALPEGAVQKTASFPVPVIDSVAKSGPVTEDEADAILAEIDRSLPNFEKLDVSPRWAVSQIP